MLERKTILSGIEILPSTAQPSPGGEVELLSRSFAVAAEDVPATRTVVRLTDRGQLVGTVELLTVGQGDGGHLVVGGQEWFKPDYLFSDESYRAHFAAVAERLLDEAVAVAEGRGLSLSSVTPGSLSSADRLAARGFRQAGDLWYRERPAPGGVVDGGVVG